MNIELHMFTNCTILMPSTKMIRDTYRSFVETFGNIPVKKIWCDPKPKVACFHKYYRNLLKNFQAVEQTTGLADGYIKAILYSKADYLFMLEHDWKFNSELITNSLEEIIDAMKKYELYHLRFNKRDNIVAGWDTWLDECGTKKFKFCKTPILSNNPHIIDRKKYLEFIKAGFIQKGTGSLGIEDVISKYNVTGAIYGPKNYPATLDHKDGRRVKK